MVGRVNELKIANFLEIDIFVLIACGENSILDGKDFYRPVITPFEMQLACVRGKEWDGTFVTNFHSVLPNTNDELENEKYDYDSDEEADFSLLTGQYRNHNKYKNSDYGVGNGNVVLRSQENQLVQSAAADYLSKRSYQGLDPALGKTEVKKAVVGMNGIAKGYSKLTIQVDEDKDEEKRSNKYF